jgi:sec-independent protein translocase protein TatA
MSFFTAPLASLPATLGFISLPNGYEWLVILGIGLLIFGKRLPGAARGIGQSIVEFKKGLKGGEKEAEEAGDKQIAEERKPRFDPQTGKPLVP